MQTPHDSIGPHSHEEKPLSFQKPVSNIFRLDDQKAAFPWTDALTFTFLTAITRKKSDPAITLSLDVLYVEMGTHGTDMILDLSPKNLIQNQQNQRKDLKQ